jgi:predicted GH43/DUF377 family glycosyl hydrolase
MKKPIPIDKGVLISPSDINASSEEMNVVGTFNPGVTYTNFSDSEKTLFMIRVAETPKESSENYVCLPYFSVKNTTKSHFRIKSEKINRKSLLREGKKEVIIPNGTSRLKHISYPLIATSKDGRTLDYIEDTPSFYPCYEHERFGIEDVRITRMEESSRGDYYLFTYVSPHREKKVSTSISQTWDFKNFKRLPFGNPNVVVEGGKDIAIFPDLVMSPYTLNSVGNPEMVYAALKRPDSFSDISPPSISITYSNNLLFWGLPDSFIVPNNNKKYVGTGSSPVMINNFNIKGKKRNLWMGVYHETEKINVKGENKNIYRGKLFAIDCDSYKKRVLGNYSQKENPWGKPYLSGVLTEPTDFDLGDGYVPNVDYPTGFIIRDGIAHIYSGKDDSHVVWREYYLEDLVKYVVK